MPPIFARPINDFATTLAVKHVAGDGVLSLSSAAGLSALGADEIYRVTVGRNMDTAAEVILGIFEATGLSGPDLTGVTAAEGYADTALSAGYDVQIRPTARTITELQDAIRANLAALEVKLAVAANLSDLADVIAARTNLGLGDAATHPASDFLSPTGDGSGLTGLTLEQIAGLIDALASKADDAAVVHNAGDEVVDGQKSFTGAYTTFGTADAGAHLLASGYRNELFLAFPGDRGTYHTSEGPISFSSGDRGTGNPSLTLNPDGTASHLSILATGTTAARGLADRFARELHAKDFGATGDGTTDDTAALQAWLDAAILAGARAILDRPSVAYRVTDTLLIAPASGSQCHFDLEGLFGFPGAIRWDGGNDKAVIRAVGWKLSTILNINIAIPAGASGVTGWDLDNTAAAPSLSDLTFANCRVDFGTGATSCHGWRLGHGTEWDTATDGPIDQNGDISFLSFLGCTVNGAETGGGNAGWRSEHQNVLNNSWYNGCASRVDYGITNIPSAGAAASGGKGGQSIFTHGFGTTRNVVDYEFGTVGSYGIFGGRYELGTTFLKVPPGLGSAGLAVAVSGSELGGYDLAGGHVLDIGSSANVHLDGVTVYPNATPFGPGMVNLASAAGVPGSLRLTNCLLGGTAPLHTIAGGSGPWTVRYEQCQTIDPAGLITGTIDDYATDLAAKAPAASPTFTGDVTIDVSASTTAAPSNVGFSGGASDAWATRLMFGDPATSIQGSFGGQLQVNAWWGIVVSGNRQGDPQAFASGGPSDASLTVLGTQPGAPVLAARAAPGQTAPIHVIEDSDGNTLASITAAGVFAGDGSGLTGVIPAIPGICHGRLTLTSGTPVTESDVTGAGTVYWTPFGGNQVALFDGSAWSLRGFAETALSLASGFADATNYDVFAHDNAGTLALEAVAWADDTTRATDLTYQDGVLCKSGDLTRRYLGTLRTTSATTTEDSDSRRFVFNHHNRVPRRLKKVETTYSWTYNGSNAFRSANGNDGNRVEVVSGWADARVDLTVTVTNANDGADWASPGIGIDSTTVNSADLSCVGAGSTPNSFPSWAKVDHRPLGYHYYQWLDYNNTGTTTYCSAVPPASKVFHHGLLGSIDA